MMNYKLCNQTITLYDIVRVGADKQYRKTVINGVYFESNKNYTVNKTGLSSANSFTCIIPQNAGGKLYVPPIAYQELVEITNRYTLNPQDRIVLGVCAKEFITNDTTWASFKCDNMVIVKNIDEKHYRGELVHLEVGG